VSNFYSAKVLTKLMAHWWLEGHASQIKLLLHL